MRLITLITACIATVVASPPSSRIVGGSVTTIDRWPSHANVMFASIGVTFSQSCGGTIINNRSVMSAAHCVRSRSIIFPVNLFRFRLGSTWASSGGVLHNVAQNIIHPSYNPLIGYDSDIVIMRSATTFVYSNVLQQGSIASVNYNLGDNQVVWVTGWGAQWSNGPASEQLREVQVWTVNQNICAQRYGAFTAITANMLCTGWLDVGGRDACQGDSGGPVFHNGVVVGVTSFGNGCALASHPGVNVRVSRFTPWIQANA